jgi:TP901 family phage tail tape measure protein
LRKQRKKVDELSTEMRLANTEVKKLSTSYGQAEKKLKAQAKEMKSADTVTKQMTASYKASQREVSGLAAALEKKKIAFKTSASAARAAGVDTKRLTAEEKRLQKASKETGNVWAARRALGVKSHKDIKAEVARLSLAYVDLKKSGKATTLELFQAKQKLKTKTAELTTANHAWGSSFTAVQTGVLALAGIGYGLVKTFKEFAGFESGMAEVNTLLDISIDQFAAFKKETKDVVGDLPQQSADLTKALYDIISAGVDLGDSTTVLEQAARAATAGITDSKTAVNIGLGSINAYGDGVEKLEGNYDILFNTVKRGVTTFPELSQSIGDVLPIARAADVDLKNVGAAVAALTKAGIKTPQAATAIKGAIRAMAAPAPEAKKEFDALGLSWQGLLPTLEAIREKGLSIDQMRMLIPDVEASTAVLSLTQNLDEFRDILASMDYAGGSMETAYEKMADTPDHEIKLMLKSVHDLGVGLGQLASLFLLPAARTLGYFIDVINDSPAALKFFISAIGSAVAVGAVWYLGLNKIVTAIAGMAIRIYEGAAATGVFTGSVAAARAGMAKLTAVMMANPIVAGLTVAILAGAAAWAIFGKGSLEASKDHAAAAKIIGDGRKEIDKEIISLEKLKDAFEKTSPGSKEYLYAERELAALLPGANISLDEHGRMIAKVGDATSENKQKLDGYLASLREESRISLGLQLEQQAKAYGKAGDALDQYKNNLQNWYGMGDDAGGPVQSLWLAINKLTGTYDKNIQKGEEVRGNLGTQKAAYNRLIGSIAKTGMSSEALSASLDKAKVSAELKSSIIADYGKLSGAIGSVTTAANKSAAEQEKAFADAAANIKQEYLNLASELKGILDDIANRQQSLSEDLRDIGRDGMSGSDAWQDLKKEADEYYNAAQNAAMAGDFDESVKLADKAKAKYKELNTEVKENGKVMITAEEGRKAAAKGVERAGQLAIDTLKEQAGVVSDNAEALEKQIGTFKKGWRQAWNDFLTDGTKSIDTLEKKLDELTKPRTVKVTAVEGKQFGGIIGLKMQLGGRVGAQVQRLATGGGVGYQNAMNGLHLSGYGGGDCRWILGEDGEVMIKKESVKLAGARAALAFNAGRWDIVVSELVSRFGLNVGDVVRRRFGGFIDAVSAPSSSPQMLAAGGLVQGGGDPGGDTYNMHFSFAGNVSQPSRQNAKELAAMVMSEWQRVHRGSSK